MKFDYLIPCMASSHDVNSNNISIFNVMERISINKPEPSSREKINFPLHIIGVISREGEAGTQHIRCEIQIRNPQGELNTVFEGNVSMAENMNRMRIRGDFFMSITTEGDYYIVMNVKEPQSKSIDYKVEVRFLTKSLK